MTFCTFFFLPLPSTLSFTSLISSNILHIKKHFNNDQMINVCYPTYYVICIATAFLFVLF
ncbi:hypothetical protein K450DRAFT_220242 [Umbelopsis ramanniana AG]|uniref:Uncharacterized protein n=1 Tax=Umbelopsis ramanniana AG TaxID=1314678 RepID=A0AAD5EIB8_UMBRA|nr:uncharacterized protein K450DRAFT_220242 [Umbelopsis ramanniana AG]KAI8583842.1 hypothetical protein K450DRAFT_220242 [Umbelopsis ramanniana AG]